MKKLMLFGFAVFVVVLAVTKESIADTNKEQKLQGVLQKMHDHHNTCSKEFGQPPGYLIQGFQNIKKEDEAKVGAFSLCVLSKLGLISENGAIIEDGVRSFITDFHGDSDREKKLVQKVLTICKPLVDSQLTPQYKALAFAQCKEKQVKPK
ncbi:uncharacterized protein LOC114336833 isoform X1 [Diabrotica virgifera virgifera]|uniref:Uncharacterized protein LOC114336833 isoform X1 n=1 Tax=Diabrotica virgifera virgifera TaxID=50390 RepID=A0A6P7G291_DIAVI|nr:uncharacterized protein LOC114336833 isoform X1 [Diabrotica virgifera virgifera]